MRREVITCIYVYLYVYMYVCGLVAVLGFIRTFFGGLSEGPFRAIVQESWVFLRVGVGHRQSLWAHVGGAIKMRVEGSRTSNVFVPMPSSPYTPSQSHPELLGNILGPWWRVFRAMKASARPLEPSWGHLGAPLGCSWGHLGIPGIVIVIVIVVIIIPRENCDSSISFFSNDRLQHACHGGAGQGLAFPSPYGYGKPDHRRGTDVPGGPKKAQPYANVNTVVVNIAFGGFPYGALWGHITAQTMLQYTLSFQ